MACGVNVALPVGCPSGARPRDAFRKAALQGYLAHKKLGVQAHVLETLPWFLRVYLHTLRFEVDGIPREVYFLRILVYLVIYDSG